MIGRVQYPPLFYGNLVVIAEIGKGIAEWIQLTQPVLKNSLFLYIEEIATIGWIHLGTIKTTNDSLSYPIQVFIA